MWNPFKRKQKNTVKSETEALLASFLRSAEPTERAHDHFERGAMDIPNALIASEAERARLRSWCKKEYLDNPHARHLARSYSLAAYGTGPTLQVTTDDNALNSAIENLFAEWREAVELDWKWHLALESLFYDGEAFFHYHSLPTVAGGIGVELIEARRIAEPDSAGMVENRVEGITYNEYGQPTSYSVEKECINPYFGRPREFVEIPASQIEHFYIDDVVNQRRGLPLLQSSLHTLGSIQRISEASRNAWEMAARLSIIIESSIDAADLIACLPKGATDSGNTVPAFKTVDVPKDGGGLLLPTGFRPTQMRNEHPTSQYADTKTAFVVEAGLGVGAPRNISTGDSSPYNYSSAQLDNEIFSRLTGTIQRHITPCLNRALLMAVASQVHEKPEASAFLAKVDGRKIPTNWHFCRMLEGIDRMKDASADVALLGAGLETIRGYCSRHGIDYDRHMAEIERERNLGGDAR